MKIRACIFDFDGTLVDSLKDVFESLLHAFAASGIKAPELNPESIMQHQLSDAIKAAAPGITKEQRGKVIEAFKEHYDKSDYPNTIPLPGVVETLEDLKKRAVPCFIVSNKRQKPMLRILNNLKLEEYFSDVFNPDMFSDTRIRKTKAELIAALIDKHALEKSQTAYVGDMEIDVIAAKENGLVAVAVVNGYGNAENYRVRPDFVMHRVSEVLAIAG